MRKIIPIALLISGCTEVRECLTCKGQDKILQTCEEDVLGWNTQSLIDHYTTHGYDTCIVSFEDRVLWSNP